MEQGLASVMTYGANPNVGMYSSTSGKTKRGKKKMACKGKKKPGKK